MTVSATLARTPGPSDHTGVPAAAAASTASRSARAGLGGGPGLGVDEDLVEHGPAASASATGIGPSITNAPGVQTRPTAPREAP